MVLTFFLLLRISSPQAVSYFKNTLYVVEFDSQKNEGFLVRVNDDEYEKLVSGLKKPMGFTITDEGVYLIDSDRVLLYKDGKLSVLLEEESFPSQPSLFTDIAIDSFGNLFIVDFLGGSVYRFDGEKVDEYLKLDSPWGVVVDSFGNLYISIFSHPGKVVKYNGENVVTILVSPDINGAKGITLDREGKFLYVGGYDTGKIMRVNLRTRRPEIVGRGFYGITDLDISPDGSELVISTKNKGKLYFLKVKPN